MCSTVLPPLAIHSNTRIEYNQRAQPGAPVEPMNIELLINFNQFWTRLTEDIGSAQQSVFVQTFAFEGDTIGNQLSEALLSSPASEKRILADSFTRFVLSDRFRFSPANVFDRSLRHEARETAAMMSRLNSAGVA